MIKGVTNTTARYGGTYPCPRDGQEARLVVDLASKWQHPVPVRDPQDNVQYYCLTCHQRFSVNSAGQVVTPSTQQ